MRILLIAAGAGIVLIVLAGCTRQIPVAAPTSHIDHRIERAASSDTIYIGDSIHITTVADTVRETRVRTIYRTHTERDTVAICRVDTVTTIIEVEKAASGLKSMFTGISGLMALIGVISLIGIWVKAQYKS